MEHMPTACPFCKAQADCCFVTTDRNRRVRPDAFRYWKCPACGLVFLDPVPADLGAYYPPDYYFVPASLAELQRLARPERYKIELVQRLASGGRLLEIGPAFGNFAYLARAAGFAVEVVEMDARCCEFLSSVVGVRAVNSADVFGVLPALGPYEVIALWQVIEHVTEPWSLLEAAVDRLVPGGLLVVATPNPRSLQLRLFQGAWTHIDAPRHLTLIPHELLCRWLTPLKMKSALCTTTDRGSLGWNAFGWQYSLMNYFTNPAARFLARVAGRLLGLLCSPLERTGWRGTAYTALFKKEGGS
jgi:2-polyprenyl-3-methyl-5-hydroxy-6-metoxy-1,4-benzoquinol methylase